MGYAEWIEIYGKGLKEDKGSDSVKLGWGQ
jgi:hypothetical protein